MENFVTINPESGKVEIDGDAIHNLLQGNPMDVLQKVINLVPNQYKSSSSSSFSSSSFVDNLGTGEIQKIITTVKENYPDKDVEFKFVLPEHYLKKAPKSTPAKKKHLEKKRVNKLMKLARKLLAQKLMDFKNMTPEKRKVMTDWVKTDALEEYVKRKDDKYAFVEWFKVALIQKYNIHEETAEEKAGKEKEQKIAAKLAEEALVRKQKMEELEKAKREKEEEITRRERELEEIKKREDELEETVPVVDTSNEDQIKSELDEAVDKAREIIKESTLDAELAKIIGDRVSGNQWEEWWDAQSNTVKDEITKEFLENNEYVRSFFLVKGIPDDTEENRNMLYKAIYAWKVGGGGGNPQFSASLRGAINELRKYNCKKG
jgi:chemotaxis protein histidine kinase CheA